MIDAAQINAAYDALNAAHGALTATTLTEQEQRAYNERLKAEHLMSGEIDGKNAETRDAQVSARMSAELDRLHGYSLKVTQARAHLTITQNDVDRCKTLLKLLEVTKGGIQ